MLDLNLDTVSSESSCDENMNNNDNKVKVLASMEESGSTKSSIINDEDVLKETDDATVGKKVENPSLEFVTRQLFPVTGEKSGVELEFGIEPLASRPKWLNLSYADGSCTGEAEMMTVPVKPQPKKSRRGPRSRSSQYRGVTFYRRTGRWESHIWDCGKQVYLGGFDTAHAAARAYDRVAIKFRGVEADINFTLSDYEEDMKHMKDMSKEEFVHALRRQSNGFSRGNSKYRGVTLHKCGRWEARMGQYVGKKAYDMAATKSTYEGGKCDHNLDLSLGISAPPVAGNIIDDARDSILRDAAVGEQPQHGVYHERTISRRDDATSWIGYSNSAWQMQGGGKIINSTPVFPIAAASSGFSSSIAIASSTTLPFDNSGRNPTPATSTENYRS